LKKQIYIAIAFLFVGMGTLGIFLPLLPTTPFLLLAVYFFMNSSRSRLKWLLSHKHLGPYIRSYLSKEGIPLKLKARTIALLWATILSTAIFATEKLHVRILLGVIATGVTIHIASKKTKKEDDPV
jgi:uncharacterized membrane protein YbaN (DUF454 family)